MKTHQKFDTTFTQLEGGIVRKLTRLLIEFVKKEEGPTAVEYAIMMALLVTICIGVLTTIDFNGAGLSTTTPATVTSGRN